METDEALYARLLGGELDAFDQLYERYERPLYGFVRSQLGGDADSEDVFHEAFVAVLHAGRQRAELRSFKAWLFQVARPQCRNRIRSRNRASRALESVAQQVSEPAPARDTGELPGAVARLPAALAEVYHLRARGLSYDELAAILDVPVGTVKSRMHEMVKRLREEMK